jgi:hypothetical protein
MIATDRAGERAERRAARATIGAYNEAQLRLLLDRVRDGFSRLDAGEIDAFELDELIHRDKRSARELWKFCGQTGSDWVTSARTLEFWQQQGEVPDWGQPASHDAGSDICAVTRPEPRRPGELADSERQAAQLAVAKAPDRAGAAQRDPALVQLDDHGEFVLHVAGPYVPVEHHVVADAELRDCCRRADCPTEPPTVVTTRSRSQRGIGYLLTSEQTHTQVQLLFASALEDQALLGPDGLPPDHDPEDPPILVAWSDNGAEMTAIDTRQFMALMAIAQHHGRPGTPTDQAHVESFFSH